MTEESHCVFVREASNEACVRTRSVVGCTPNTPGVAQHSERLLALQPREQIMQYPLYVHRNGNTGFCASFPDFPTADASGDSFNELTHNAQATVEAMYDRSEQLIPVPTCNTTELQALQMDDGDGIWVFVDIDLARVTSKSVGIQVNLLESLLQQVDARSRERRMTRSAFVTLALIDELEKHDG
jgi:predicted RNase H-like HicB family nuclease